MFSRVLKPVTVVAAQNGAKNFSTTSQVKISIHYIVIWNHEYTLIFNFTRHVFFVSTYHFQLYTKIIGNLNSKCDFLEEFQSGGGRRIWWYRPAPGPALEAKPSSDPASSVRYRAGDSWRGSGPLTHRLSSQGHWP